MKIKFDSKMTTKAGDALSRYARPLYEAPGRKIVGIIELSHDERNETAPDSDKELWVKLRITGLEIGQEEQEHLLRGAMRALYLHRTATGTLDENQDVQLAEGTLRLIDGHLHAAEAARLRTAAVHWHEYARKASHLANPTVTELLHELATIADGIGVAVYGLRDNDSEG